MTPSRRNFLVLLLTSAIALPAGVLAQTATKKRKIKPKPKPKPPERVVLQVSESDSKRWNLVLNTAKTLETEYGEGKIDIAIVAFGPGINMLKNDADVANRVQTAVDRKVTFIACGSSMKTLNVDAKSLADKVSIVPSGAAELIRRQRDGWAYMRP